ncbi:hypothetical protein GCM10010168_36480 [Actinoplanes ianthinogenes]|uniref:Uncharacterized protein n=1 Tax=Actinoplanes ianthinogenes TaxID=122358 RepID=A0ABM7M598_9ACTN|nr:hypothetical protein [Actinoplanes ianthinogenes]BCJ46830.1 hypothetical protein Aiant_74870 [Actinoplanes ianthinogenes]GGR15224.1 hypothetical protein GCM10010168_36480 [Actinoplanes ianthinogenes]
MTLSGRCRAAGLAVGAGLGFAVSRSWLFDYAPVILALAVVIGMLAGEAVTPRPAREPGGASLRVRRIGDYLAWPDLVLIGLLGAGVAGFTELRTPPRPGHEVDYFGTAEPVTLISTFVTLGLLAALTAVLVWRIVRSPRRGDDEAWRQALVQRVVHGCGAVFAIVFTALAFWYADHELDWRGGGGSPVWGYGLSLLAGAGLVLVAHFAGTLVRPSTPPELAKKGEEGQEGAESPQGAGGAREGTSAR